MKAGQTLALAGLIQSRTEAQNRGLPWLSDLPWVGAGFRRVQETTNEVELLILVRPELVDALDPHEAPQCGPGESTTSPRDVDLYFRGYLEVPKCCPDGSCPNCQGGNVVPGQPVREIELPYGGEQGAPASQEAVEPLPANPSAGDSAARSILKSRQRVAAQPIAPRWGFQPSPNQNSTAANSRTDKTATAGDFSPGLFGNVGYDVLDSNK